MKHSLVMDQNYRRIKGLTLFEVIISISIIAGILLIGIPGYQNLLLKINARSAIEKLQLAINYARSQAIAHHQIVRLCPSSDGQYCDNHGQWEQGWITYIDKTASIMRTQGDPLLQIYQGFDGIIIRKNGRDKTIRFNPYGQIGLNRSFSVCYSNDLTPVNRIVIIHSGRVRIDKEKINCN